MGQESGSFGSFQELARHSRAEEMKQGGRPDMPLSRETNHELFREILEGHFDQVPSGEFTINQNGIDTVSIGRIGGPNAEPNQLFATFFYKNAGGRQASFTWSIGQDGTFSGDIPRGVVMNRLALTRSVLDVMDKVGVGFWHLKDDEFLGQADPGKPREQGEGGAEPRPSGIDPERLKFLREQPGALTGFVSNELGFQGYHAAIYPDRIVLEHPEYGNAIYVVHLDHNILTDDALAERDVQRRLTPEESDYVYDRYWKPIGAQAETKNELRSIPGLVVKKMTHGGKDWKARLSAALQEPLPEAK